MQDLILIL